MLGTGISMPSLALRGTTALSQVLRPVLTANPSVAPLIAVAGTEVTRTQGTYAPNGGGSVNITLSEFRVDGSQVATGASYTPLLSDVGGSFAYFEQATQTGGDADGQQSTLFTLAIGAIVHAQATATGSIPDQNLTHTGDVVTVVADVSTLFSGEGLSYAVSGYAGASLNGNALEIDPAALTAGATVTLTASNTNPTDADITFNLVVEALDFASLSLAGSGLVGTTHTVTATANRTGATFSYDWQDDQGSIGAADQNTYSPVDNQDQEDLSAIVSVSLDGVTVQQETNSIAITYAAPTAAGALADQSFTEATGIQTYDVSGDFMGAVGGSYSVQSGPVTVSSAGVVSHDTDALTPQTGTSVVIRYTNSGGFADSGYSLDIVAPLSFGLEETSEEPVITINSGAVTITINAGPYAGTYTTDYLGNTLTVTALQTAPMCLVLPVIAGTIQESETITATPGLWLYEGADLGDQTFSWVNNTDGATTDTDLSYDIVAGDVGDTLKIRETYGGVSVDSLDTAVVTGAGGGTVNPGDVTGLFAHFDFSDDTTVTVSGNNITAVARAGGSSNLSLLPNLTAPTWGVETINGVNAASFGGSGYLQDSSFPPFTADGTLIIVHEPGVQGTNAANSIFAFNGTDDFQIDNGTASTAWHGSVNSTEHGTLARSTAVPAGVVIQVYRWDSTTDTARLYTNGVLDATVTDFSTTYSTSGTRYAYGTNRGGNAHYVGKIGEGVHYDNDISDADLNAVAAGLAAKWGGTWSDI